MQRQIGVDERQESDGPTAEKGRMPKRTIEMMSDEVITILCYNFGDEPLPVSMSREEFDALLDAGNVLRFLVFGKAAQGGGVVDDPNLSLFENYHITRDDLNIIRYVIKTGDLPGDVLLKLEMEGPAEGPTIGMKNLRGKCDSLGGFPLVDIALGNYFTLARGLGITSRLTPSCDFAGKYEWQVLYHSHNGESEDEDEFREEIKSLNLTGFEYMGASGVGGQKWHSLHHFRRPHTLAKKGTTASELKSSSESDSD